MSKVKNYYFDELERQHEEAMEMAPEWFHCQMTDEDIEEMALDEKVREIFDNGELKPEDVKPIHIPSPTKLNKESLNAIFKRMKKDILGQ